MAGSEITLREGAAMTASFRQSHPNLTKALYFSRDVYEAILEQDDCEGIRIYNAINENGVLTHVLVGVDKFGNDLLPGKVYDYAIPSPPATPLSNPLNS
jgi:hypothetical protein